MKIKPGHVFTRWKAPATGTPSALLKQAMRRKSLLGLHSVMLHIANAGDTAGARKWFDEASSHGVSWDVTVYRIIPTGMEHARDDGYCKGDARAPLHQTGS